MATNPNFVSTGQCAIASVSVANTATDGTGTITPLITGVVAGTRILEIDVQVVITGASTAALINVFMSVDSGSTWKLYDQIAVAAATGSTSVKSARNIATYSNCILPGTAYHLGITTTVSQATNVFCHAGDLT